MTTLQFTAPEPAWVCLAAALADRILEGLVEVCPPDDVAADPRVLAVLAEVGVGLPARRPERDAAADPDIVVRLAAPGDATPGAGSAAAQVITWAVPEVPAPGAAGELDAFRAMRAVVVERLQLLARALS
jgi:hypothetical protein